MALSSEIWQKINRCLVRLYRELDAEKQPRLMLEVLHELVHLDSSGLNVVAIAGPDAGRIRVVTRPENFATAEQSAAIGRYAHQSPFAAYFFATQDFSWKMPSDFIPEEEFRKLELYELGQKPLGIHYHMVGLLAVMGGTLHGISIHRSERGFDEQDREILNAIQPHLVNSYLNAIVHSRAQDTVAQLQAAVEAAPGAYGYFDAQGKVVWLQDKAAEWLREFFPHEVMHADRLPHSVRQLMERSARKELVPQTLEQVGEREILVICLGISPVGGWVLRLDRRLKEFRPRFRPLPQFTRRKNEVLQWMVEGKRNADIAKILHLSPRTVEKHVADILAELGVENRASAILKAMEFCAMSAGVGS